MANVNQLAASSKLVIVMACFHPNPDFFVEQIKSLQKQTCSDWICVVSDDSVDPKSIQFIQSKLLEDSRFIYLSNPGARGVVSNFENALKNIPISSEYIFFCDQDDIWHADKMEQMLKYFQENPEMSVVHSDLRQVDSHGKLLHSSVWTSENRHLDPKNLLELLLHPCVTGCSMAIRQSLLNQVLPFPQGNEAEKILHDHWISLIAFSQKKLGKLNRTLIDYRQHAGNVVGARPSSLFSWKKIQNFKIKSLILPAWERHVLAKHLLQRDSNIFFHQEDQKILKIFTQGDAFGFLWELAKSHFLSWKNGTLYLRIFLGLIYRPWKKVGTLNIQQK
jgi:glycosyltransferase involved in cell wall biosynthesis